MSDAGYSMLGAGAWGWPREMLWGGRREGGSCLGTHVRITDFKIKKIENWKKKIKKQNKTKASILWHSAFFIVQLSHPYMTTGKTIALTRWTFGTLENKFNFYYICNWNSDFLSDLKNTINMLKIFVYSIINCILILTSLWRQFIWFNQYISVKCSEERKITLR